MIAESFERIHRSNLVGMGVLPLLFKDGQNRKSLRPRRQRDHRHRWASPAASRPRMDVACTHPPRRRLDARRSRCSAAIDTLDEVDYFRHGGILHYVLRQLLEQAEPAGRAD